MPDGRRLPEKTDRGRVYSELRAHVRACVLSTIGTAARIHRGPKTVAGSGVKTGAAR